MVAGCWLVTTGLTAFAQQHQEMTLTDNWQFSHDQQTWQTVSIPHDWAIAGPFDKKWDLQLVAIEQNGEKEPTEKSGRSGALPWIGQGYYKRTFRVPKGYDHVELLFDGAMAEPRVSVNGEEAGYWAYGYNAFRVDVSQLVHPGENLLEVSLQNVEESSRWYPGAGIYRPVKLMMAKSDWIDPWKTFIRTTALSSDEATLQVTVGSGSPLDAGQNFIVEIHDAEGQLVAEGRSQKLNNNGEAEMQITVDNPLAWSPESPNLYTAVIKYLQDDRLLDQTTQRFGIRTVAVSKENGFQLNGRTRKIKGVCLHHDLGPLGVAINKAALIRQIKQLKEMGCDAIRTAHNMPSTMQMEICDSLGMMVMAETFDMWRYPKCKNGYARFFDEWWYRDIENLILNHRNHPSIIMWSIGNEIPEQWSEEGRELAQELQEACHGLDPTRPVTQGMDRADEALKSGFAQVMDVPGFNYRVHKYQRNIEQLPQGFLLGSETASTVSSRGVYKFPVVPTDNSQFASYSPNYDPTALARADGQCSSYDVEWCSWSNLPDDDWVWQDDKPWVIGEFVWTGYDYLGEPTPYDEYWPSRSSYFGIMDLAGLPKDRYWLYRSKWQCHGNTIHLLPHWSWPDRIGEVTPVYCYTNYPEAELFVNGKSQGRIKKQPGERLDRYRLRWNDVRYEPGELKVVIYNVRGERVGEQTTKTPGKPAKLRLDCWTQHDDTDKNRPVLTADGDDMAFVTVSLTDEQGTLIPDAQDKLTFTVSGAGTFEAVCNGDATSLEPFRQPTIKLFNGQLVCIVRSAREAGELTLTVSDGSRSLRSELKIAVR